MRFTFTPVYASGGGGTVSPGNLMIPIGAMSLSSRYETPRSGVLSLADEEEGGVIVEEKNNLDDVNRKTKEPERVIGEGEEDEKGLKMDVDVRG